jgi:heterodisulfide reductase subunit B
VVTVTTAERSLAAAIARRAEVNVARCYQCKRCTGGCPVTQHFDLAPHQLMRAIQLGQRDRALGSKTIWLCTGCQTCTSRCPQDVDVARVLETLRILAEEEGIRPAVPPVQMFNRCALRGIRLFGRMYELGLMIELYARLFLVRMLDLRQLVTADAPMAIRMFVKGKLRLLPTRARRRKRRVPAPVVAAGAGELQIGYSPGCSLHGTAIDFGMSTRAIAGRLGIDLVEPEGWICCGASAAHTTDRVLATTLPMHNLALFAAAGQDCVMMPCASCYLRAKTAIYDVERKPELRAAVTQEIGYTPTDTIRVEHIIETLEKRVGLQRITGQVVRPLHGVKVVCYYGCVLTRPPKIVQQPNPEYPRSMDRLVDALGAQPLDWSYKTDCCGASLALSQLPIMLQLCARILRNAQEVGAEAVIVACPLCHANLDLRQSLLHLPKGPMPIIYITQLLGLAFGLPAQQLGLNRHLTDPMPFLQARGLAAHPSPASSQRL